MRLQQAVELRNTGGIADDRLLIGIIVVELQASKGELRRSFNRTDHRLAAILGEDVVEVLAAIGVNHPPGSSPANAPGQLVAQPLPGFIGVSRNDNLFEVTDEIDVLAQVGKALVL